VRDLGFQRFDDVGRICVRTAPENRGDEVRLLDARFLVELPPGEIDGAGLLKMALENCVEIVRAHDDRPFPNTGARVGLLRGLSATTSKPSVGSIERDRQ
jgi:hypothetical protein